MGFLLSSLCFLTISAASAQIYRIDTFKIKYFNMWFSRYVLTEVYQSLASSIYLNLLITGKNQLLTALPCWNGLTHSSSRTSPLSPPARTCLFYLKTLSSIFQIESGTHLLSHAVSSIVPSAAYVLTVVFGMGTGVSHKRIGTGIFVFSWVSAERINKKSCWKLAFISDFVWFVL